MGSRIFLGGVPTRPDVEKLLAKIDVSHGSIIPYRMVEDIIGIPRDQNRWRTVTEAWRKRLFRERRLQIIAEGESFKALTAAEAVAHGAKRLNAHGRAVGRTATRVDSIDAAALTETQKQQHALVRRHSFAALTALRDACNSIAAPKPVAASLRLARTSED